MPINLSGITWILTYNCNLHCDHCFFDVRGPKAVLDTAMARAALESLNGGSPLQWQHVSGGEPLLHINALHDLVDAIRDYGTAQVGIATNGFWASTRERADATVAELKTHGVTGVCISADNYHADGVSVEAIGNACKAVTGHGLDGHSWVVSCDDHGIPGLDTCGLPVATVDVRRIGHGAELASSEAGIPDAPCTQLCCCMGETTPFDPKMIWIDPHGNVMICYGLTIGNLKEMSLQEILERYTVGMNPILSTLADRGPIGLYHMAVEKGWQAPATFADECHLCHASRRYMRGAHAESLLPDECYPATACMG